jgi:hypothetical protein
MTQTRHYQTKYPSFIDQNTTTPNLPPTGDEIPQVVEIDTIRFAFQNIHGVKAAGGLTVSPEIEAMSEWNVSIMGMAETNRPWTAQQKSEYDFMMASHFFLSRTLYTAAPTHDHDQKYLPGGNLLTINGPTMGRIYDHGSDKMGRFCWYALRGKRDEGVLVIVAYRVCHKASDNPGPFTAYRQQHTYLRSEGIANPNPRKQILQDITTLISSKREEGLRPILMMDANGDYLEGNDKELRDFINANGLADPFYDRFQISPPTFIHGTKRIDYIFMDPSLTGAIKRIGYLGTHEGIFSDHVMAVMDMDERTLFAGLLNRPPPKHSREILIAQEDKVQAFIHTTKDLLKEHAVQRRVFELASAFVTSGATDTNIATFHRLYQQFLELSQSAAKTAGRKKYGYKRSPALVHAARMKCAYKMILDCKLRKAGPSPALIRYCTSLDIDATSILTSNSERILRKTVRQLGKELWECQKAAESLREEGLQKAAQNSARIAAIPDWERKMAAMIKTTKDNAVNRKLSLITKGRRGVLDRIQIPTHTWFYSPSKQELYHYDSGVFEAYPAFDKLSFCRHHTLKVPASDIALVEVQLDAQTHRWRITRTLPTPRTFWVDITSQKEIESALLFRNKRHLQQTAREEGISTIPPMSILRQNNGFNDMATKVLEGAPITAYELTPEMATFFEALKRNETDSKLPPVLGEFTSEDIQAMFKAAKERTSSDSRTLNYTLWKCLAADDSIAGILSILFSLPFTYGFVNTHWTSMTDFMLEKKPGLRHIHMLRIIGKVAAEFNTCLKFLIGKRTRDNYEASEACDEQHGFRPNRSSIDAVMLKLFTFECARMQKYTVATIQHDMTAHFDRMDPSLTSVLGSKYGVDANIMNCINGRIAQLKRNVETALGISDGIYCQLHDEPHLGGMVQGKADVPQWSTQQSDAMLKAHKALTHGVQLYSPNMQREIQHSSVAFADDTDGQESIPTEEEDAILKVTRQLQHSAQTWSNLVQICGGLIALHKCNWQLIAWESRAGILHMVTTTNGELTMDDGKGASAIIDYLPPNQPNIGLGYRLCPDGSQDHHFQATLEAITALCNKATGAHLTEAEGRQLLSQRLIPKISYALYASSFTETQCGRINSTIRKTFLPLLRLNRHFPGAVLYGPKHFGGLEFPEIRTLQDQIQLDYIIKQLRWDKTVANDFLVTLDTVQMATGLTSPILECTNPPVTYLDKSFIIDLRHRLRKIDATVWIEDAWMPKLQRVGDESLMERFCSIPGIKPSQLKHANIVRLYLRVITIADLSETSGTYIPHGMLNGDWQAGSDLKWPHQPCPPKSYFATFRRLLRKSFCTNTPIHHHHNDSMNLDRPLGDWLPVQRNVWSLAYKTKDKIYWRAKDDWDLHVLTRSTVSGFYHHSHITKDLPLDSHPVEFRQIGESIWTQRPYRMHTTDDGIVIPPGHLVENVLSDPISDTLTIGCDGSVYLKDEVAACAWMIADSESSKATACFLLSNISSISSYRSELEGIYRSLLHVQYLGLTPLEIQQWCDNESAVNDSNRPLCTPSAMGKADADLLLAIHHLRSAMEDKTKIMCRHIYGHQDTKQRDGPRILQDEHTTGTEDNQGEEEYITPFWETNSTVTADPSTRKRTHTLPVTTNIEADRLASETATIALKGNRRDITPTLQPPYTGSKAMLKIKDKWITSRHEVHIRQAHGTPGLRQYCISKYNWDDVTFDMVDWTSIGKARKKCSPTQLMQTSKIMHDWLPVMHMYGHITGLQQCPACTHTDETLDHLFHCRNPALVRSRTSALTALIKKGKTLRLPFTFTDTIRGMLLAYFDEQDYEPTRSNRYLRDAIEAQTQIGIHLLPRGYFAKQWLSVLESFRCEHADRKLASFIYFIWTEVTDTIWRTRNDIVHHGTNLNRLQDESRIDRSLIWFQRNKREALARTDYGLTTYDIDALHILTLASKRERLRQLQVAKAAFDIEKTMAGKGQHTITRYFTTKTTSSTQATDDDPQINSEVA